LGNVPAAAHCRARHGGASPGEDATWTVSA
jgi:hypothetical protein